MIDEYKLKGLLEALVGEPHYNAVIALVVANAAGVDTHYPIGRINRRADNLRRMLDAAIREDGENEEDEPPDVPRIVDVDEDQLRDLLKELTGTEEHTGSLLHAVGEALGMDLPGDLAVPNRRDDKRTMLKAVILRDSKPD